MSTLSNEQKAAILDHAAEIQESVDWVTGAWVQTATFGAAEDDILDGQTFDMQMPSGIFIYENSDFSPARILTGGVGKVEAGEFKACTPATMLEAAKSTCLEGAIALALFSAGQGTTEYQTIINDLSIAALNGHGDPNEWNDNHAGSKENVVTFLRYAADYHRNGDVGPLQQLVRGTGAGWMAHGCDSGCED